MCSSHKFLISEGLYSTQLGSKHKVSDYVLSGRHFPTHPHPPTCFRDSFWYNVICVMTNGAAVNTFAISGHTCLLTATVIQGTNSNIALVL